MKRPKRVRVGNHDFDYLYGTIEADDRYVYGRMNPRHTQILIDDSNAESQIRDTVLHETLHAIWSDAPHILDSETEEQVVRALTPGLLSVMRENPKLVAYLLEK